MIVSLSIHTIEISKNDLSFINWQTSHLIWNKDFCSKYEVIWDGSIILLAEPIPFPKLYEKILYHLQ
jgi:hypothetical protein